MDPVAAAMDREYRYRTLIPGLTHEQYLDEPWDVIQWMLRIQDTRDEVAQANQPKRAAGDGEPGADAGSA